MKVEIPDERIVAWSGCHPDTPVKEAIEVIIKNSGRQMSANFYAYIGYYVIHDAKEFK
jgi:hypothetical protein